MTKKDYILIAAALDAARSQQGACIDIATEQISRVLAADNPRFNRARFLLACGIVQVSGPDPRD